MWNRIPLRLRITLLSALCLLLACGLLTVFVVLNAGHSFEPAFTSVARLATPLAQTVPAIEIEVPAAVSLYRSPSMMAIQAAETTYSDARSTFTTQSVVSLVLIFILGTVLTWFITGRALRPVTALSRKMAEIDERSLTESLPVPASHDEVAALTASFNDMLGKVGTAYTAQKRFAQNAAHELKTPLAAMLTTIEVAEMDDEPTVAELQETLATVKENVLRMHVLVKDLMALQATQPQEQKETFTAEAMFETILKDLTADIGEKKLSVKVAGDVELMGNRVLLTQAFGNIVQNAVRYNRRGGTVDILCTSKGIIVRDTGIGIPEDALGRLFEPFYCVDPSRSRSLGGSGLGLAVARQIFDLHGMAVQVQSGGGQTAFTICLHPKSDS